MKKAEYYTTTYAAPAYYTESPKYYQTEAPQYYRIEDEGMGDQKSMMAAVWPFPPIEFLHPPTHFTRL
ncbi:hypothetical protein OUZ56_030440 [Daphnia magna]|uniref:Uncharacterized protein n=1 Tax=Daphnia magna TaxID=35525 RepID=A0ABQ9ZRD0_9CRUS|nr:hypothetical protein OUZ56_030440 [Daphnia magna]